jgi:hypothetical protein
MSDFTTFQTLALEEVFSILGSTVLYKGTTFPAIINDVELSNMLEDGGFMETLGTIVIVQSAF